MSFKQYFRSLFLFQKRFEVQTTVSPDTRFTKIASFEPFQLQLTEISYDTLASSEHAMESLRDGSLWAVVWCVDLSRLAEKGGLKEELTHMRKILG